MFRHCRRSGRSWPRLCPRNGWDEAMAHRLDAVAEETVLTLLERDEEGAERGRQRLLLTARKEDGRAVLEFVAAPGDGNLEDRMAPARRRRGRDSGRAGGLASALAAPRILGPTRAVSRHRIRHGPRGCPRLTSREALRRAACWVPARWTKCEEVAEGLAVAAKSLAKFDDRKLNYTLGPKFQRQALRPTLSGKRGEAGWQRIELDGSMVWEFAISPLVEIGAIPSIGNRQGCDGTR